MTTPWSFLKAKLPRGNETFDRISLHISNPNSLHTSTQHSNMSIQTTKIGKFTSLYHRVRFPTRKKYFGSVSEENIILYYPLYGVQKHRIAGFQPPIALSG